MLTILFLQTASFVRAQVVVPPTSEAPRRAGYISQDMWLDRTQQGLYRLVWHTARSIDSWMGPPAEDEVYQQASGSLAGAMLWNEFEGFDPKVRFHVDLPLPQINQRLHAFVGRTNRDEFVTERNEPSGAFPRERSRADDEDQTFAGLVYARPERHRGSFSASVGVRVRSAQLDPYIKGSYRWRATVWDDALFTVKETVFYQTSEKFGLTTRMDFERLIGESWHLRWTGSGTVSEGTSGVRGYSTLTGTRALSGRRAIVVRLGVDGDTDAEVPLHEFGVKVAYRKSVLRDWFVLELRTSLTWPQEFQNEGRKPSWGLGIGCEMFFGTDEFSNKPVTF